MMGKSSEEGANPPPQENAGGPGQKDANIYESRAETKKIIRVVTVVAYVFSVSFAAILLSVYYVFLWEPPNPRLIQRNRLIGEPQAEYLTDRLIHQRPSGSSSHHEKSATLQDIEMNPDYSKTVQAQQLVYLSVIPAPTPVLSSSKTSNRSNSGKPLKLAPGSFDLNLTPASTASTILTTVPSYLLKFFGRSTAGDADRKVGSELTASSAAATEISGAGESTNLETASSAPPASLLTGKDHVAGAVEKIKILQLSPSSRQNGQRVVEVSTESNNDENNYQLDKKSNDFHMKWKRNGGEEPLGAVISDVTSASKFHELSSPEVEEDSLAETTTIILGVSPTSDNQVTIGAGVTTEESRTQTATPESGILDLYDNLNSSSMGSLRNSPYDSGFQPKKEDPEGEEGKRVVEKGAIERKEQVDQHRGSPTPSFEERVHYADESARDILKNRK